MKQLNWFICLTLCISVLVACGSPTATITRVSITVAPSAQPLDAGGTVTLNAIVTGTGAFNTAVTWSVVSGAGTLSEITASSAILTAPNLGVDSVVQIRAVSLQDSSKTKDVTLRVNKNGGTVNDVTIVASIVALREGSSSELQGIVNGTGAINTDLNWTIDSAGVGTLSSSTGAKVTYTAPSTTFGKVVRITASSVQDSSKRKTIFLSVNPVKASIAANVSHSLALTTDGNLLSWGDNDFGQLGDAGLSPFREIPEIIPNVSNIVAIATGSGHSLALKSDGTLLSWGDDSNGQLGDDDILANKSSPVPVDGALNIIAIAAGSDYSLALESDGTLLSWGQNSRGELGDGTTINGSGTTTNFRAKPVSVLNASDIIAIAAGSNHSLALKADGKLLSWGFNKAGQLGNGSSSASIFGTVPNFVLINNIVAIAAGGSHSLALKSDGTLLSWGRDELGQLGDDSALADKTTPVAVGLASNIVAIAAGRNSSMALDSKGTLLSWGQNSGGLLGIDKVSAFEPLPIKSIFVTNAVAISAVGSSAIALKFDGTMLGWGSHSGTGINTFIPNPVVLGIFKIRVP